MKKHLLEEFHVKGHQNIRSTHRTTLEFTIDSHLSLRGTCILGLESSKSCLSLKEFTKQKLRGNAKFLVRVETDGKEDEFIGYGHPNLTLTHPTDMVFRKSTYICDRTIMIACSKSASEINREIVKCLQNPSNFALIQIFTMEED